MPEEYPLISINDIWLTDTGADSGTPCRTEVLGIDAMKFDFTGSNVTSADGTPYAFIVDNLKKGLPLEIRSLALMKDVFDDIIQEIQDAQDGDDTINITIEADTGTFDLECIPGLPKPVEFPGTFFAEQINDVVFRFIVSSVNP